MLACAGHQWTTLLIDVETAGQFTLMLLHMHAARAEGCYVLSGALAATVGERTLMLATGATVCVPPGTPHVLWNPIASTTTALLIYTPGCTAALLALEERNLSSDN